MRSLFRKISGKNFLWLSQEGAEIFETRGKAIVKRTWVETPKDLKIFLDSSPLLTVPFLAVVDTWAQKFVRGRLDPVSGLTRSRDLKAKLRSVFHSHPWSTGRRITKDYFHALAFLEHESLDLWLNAVVQAGGLLEGICSYAAETASHQKGTILQVSLSSSGTLRQVFSQNGQALFARFRPIQQVAHPLPLLEAEVGSTLTYAERHYHIPSQDIQIQALVSEGQEAFFPRAWTWTRQDGSSSEAHFIQGILNSSKKISLSFVPSSYQRSWRIYRGLQGLQFLGIASVLLLSILLGSEGRDLVQIKKENALLHTQLTHLKAQAHRYRSDAAYHKERRLSGLITRYDRLDKVSYPPLQTLEKLSSGLQQTMIFERIRWENRSLATPEGSEGYRLILHGRLLDPEILPEQARMSVDDFQEFVRRTLPGVQVKEIEGPLGRGTEQSLLNSMEQEQDQAQIQESQNRRGFSAILEIIGTE